MSSKIRVAILDDHQSSIDGYLYRLGGLADIEVVGAARFGDELMPLLENHPADVLLLDVAVPTGPGSADPYPILHVIPQLLETYPDLAVLVISMHAQRPLIQAVIEAGASGFVLKDDRVAIQELASVVRSIANGECYYSEQAHRQLLRGKLGEAEPALTARQLEALSLCAAYPEWTTQDLARKLDITHSAARNLLSGAYLRLQVSNRGAAVAKARQLGLITPFTAPSTL